MKSIILQTDAVSVNELDTHCTIGVYHEEIGKCFVVTYRDSEYNTLYALHPITKMCHWGKRYSLDGKQDNIQSICENTLKLWEGAKLFLLENEKDILEFVKL